MYDLAYILIMTARKRLNRSPLYSLIPLDDFKAVLSIDDREDKLARFCLVTSTFTIEQYCKRRFLLKQYHQRIEYSNDDYLILSEYPVQKVTALFTNYHFGQPDIVETEFYKIVPDLNSKENLPYMVILSSSILRLKSLAAFRVVYRAGYALKDVPADLAAACLELASWNLNRYRGHRDGMSGNENMPENVKTLLEPYKRRVI